MSKPIELYMIAGFLGAGKTTFLQHLLTDFKNQRVGVIINEFGDIGIDGQLVDRNGIKMVEINHGSIYCSCLKGGFIKTLIAFTKEDIDILVIESSGMSNPSGIHKILDELQGAAKGRYIYKGTIGILDAVSFLKHVRVLNAVTNQVLASDLLVINKTDMVNQNTLQEIHKKLAQLNPDAYVFETSYGKVPTDILESCLSDNSHCREASNTAAQQFSSFAIECTESVSLMGLKKVVQCLVGKALRVKGIVAIENDWYRVDVVDQELSVKQIQLSEKSRIQHTRLVVIEHEHNITGEELLNIWKSCTGAEGILYE